MLRLAAAHVVFRDLSLPEPPRHTSGLVRPPSCRGVRSIDAAVFPDGSPGYHEWVELFCKVRADDPDQKSSRTRKGILRIVL
jgi:hypothetical protein